MNATQECHDRWPDTARSGCCDLLCPMSIENLKSHRPFELILLNDKHRRRNTLGAEQR